MVVIKGLAVYRGGILRGALMERVGVLSPNTHISLYVANGEYASYRDRDKPLYAKVEGELVPIEVIGDAAEQVAGRMAIPQ